MPVNLLFAVQEVHFVFTFFVAKLAAAGLLLVNEFYECQASRKLLECQATMTATKVRAFCTFPAQK